MTDTNNSLSIDSTKIRIDFINIIINFDHDQFLQNLSNKYFYLIEKGTDIKAFIDGSYFPEKRKAL